MPRPRAATVRERSLADEIAQGVAGGQFHPLYQPIARTCDDRIVSAEALCRWRRPDGTTVPPARFIPIAEDAGLIAPLGDLVMRAAFGQLRRWNDVRCDIGLSVNLSALQLRDRDLVGHLARLAAMAGVQPAGVQLEITETGLIERRHAAIATLRALRGLGFRIALDDFGQGYSNLGYLMDFPVDTLKIDRSFVSGITGDTRAAAIVRAIVAMARDFGVETVIEGVETADQLRVIRALGVTYYQGFLLARPGSGESIATATAVHSARAATRRRPSVGTALSADLWHTRARAPEMTLP